MIRKASAARLDDSPPPAQARKMMRCRIIKAQMHIEYEQEVPDSTRHKHMRQLDTYFREFREANMHVWVPDAENDECEYGVYSDSKVIILTRGEAAEIAFGPDWREEHILIAEISWKISKAEYLETIQDYNNAREWARRDAEQAVSA